MRDHSTAKKACVVIPVLNEQEQIVQSVEKVREKLQQIWPGNFRIIIADNGSTDRTPELAEGLATRYSCVEVVRLAQRGRGGALRVAWMASDADVLAYMDVDLSTDLRHLSELLGMVACGDYDIAIGSRLLRESAVKRSFKREVLSRGYNFLLRSAIGLKVRDAQCGFKAISKRAAAVLLPIVENNHWFFDTELLAQAQWQGFRIKELPVTWVDDAGTTVKLWKTIKEDLLGIWRIRKARPKIRATVAKSAAQAAIVQTTIL